MEFGKSYSYTITFKSFAMKIRLLLFLPFFALCFFSCDNEDDSSEELACLLEEEFLESDLGDWFRTPDGSVLVFKNQDEDELRFEKTRNEFSNFSLYAFNGVFCKDTEDAQRPLQMAEAEYRTEDDLVMFVNLSVVPLAPDEFTYETFVNAKLYDFLTIQIYKDPGEDRDITEDCNIQIITTNRGNGQVTDEAHLIERYDIVDDITFQDQLFTNVYVSEGCLNLKPMYFLQGTGVIAFHDPEETLWVLDRIE